MNLSVKLPFRASACIVLLTLLLAIWAALPAAAAGGAAPLSTSGLGARFAGVGGAATALDDPAAYSWNPAGLAGFREAHLFAERSSLPVESTSFNAIGYVRPTPVGVVSLAVARLASDDIPRTDEHGTITGSFDYSELLSHLAWARTVRAIPSSSGELWVGAGLKWALQQIDEERGSGVAFDTGVQWVKAREERRPGWRLGASVQNALAGDVLWSTGTAERFDVNVRVGGVALTTLSGRETGILLDWTSLDGVVLGVEMRPFEALVVRGAYRLEDGTVHLGAGYAGGRVGLDYAVRIAPAEGTPQMLGGVHQISLVVRLP